MKLHFINGSDKNGTFQQILCMLVPVLVRDSPITVRWCTSTCSGGHSTAPAMSLLHHQNLEKKKGSGMESIFHYSQEHFAVLQSSNVFLICNEEEVWVRGRHVQRKALRMEKRKLVEQTYFDHRSEPLHY